MMNLARGRTISLRGPDDSQEAILQALSNHGGTEGEVRNLDFSIDQASRSVIERDKRPTAAIDT